jgi:hypothetical protein
LFSENGNDFSILVLKLDTLKQLAIVLLGVFKILMDAKVISVVLGSDGK